MKKIIFGLFMMILPFLGFAQVINEGFEGAAFPPTTPGNWAVLDNGVGTGINWALTTNPAQVNSGLQAAIIDRENIGAGNTSQDWLITPQIAVPANGQLRFFTRQTLVGNNGSTYEIRVSLNPTQNNLGAYTVLQSWTETTLNTTYNVYEEKLVALPYAAGTPLYIAFVKLNTQPAGTTTGDRWLIDDVKVIQQCLDPTVLTVGAITPTSASLAWTNNGSATSWEVDVQTAGSPAPTGAGTAAPTNPFVYTGLTPGTAYRYYVRANCGSGNFSNWVGPFNFVTTPAGSICSSPITVGGLPYSHTSNTNLYGDEVDTPQGGGCAGGATNYLQGAEVFYTFTPSFTGNVSISMTPTGVSSSIYVYDNCGTVGTACLAGVADNTANPRLIPLFAVTAGQDYIIVISSSTTPAAGIPYTLIIQQQNCTQPAALTATNIGTATADLSWSNPSGATSWEVAIQTAGSPIPSGSGVTAGTNINYPATGLTPATPYQYWVRADCGGGLFSAWAGPFLFNTAICDPVDRCDYVFRMTDSFGDGWNGARMEVRQNGVVVATIGSTFTTGAGPINITVPLCQNFPFELHWTVPGSFPTEVGVAVINNFGQTLYTKAPGTGAAPSMLYTTAFNCATPACLPPTALTATAITTTTASLGWNGAGATMWDVYLVTSGSPAPNAATVPTYNDVTTNPLAVTGLSALTAYQFYVRVVCSPTSDSVWAGPFSFTTLPTCPQPINLTVTTINMTDATLGWTETGTATAWNVYVLPTGSPAPTPATTPTYANVLTNPFVATGLTAATGYQFYVMAVCSPTDSSLISGPMAFNTTICNAVNQCNYTFRMTDSFGDGWNGNTMSIRQNGITVATIGSTFTTGSGPINILVPLCDDLPFELFWNAGGSFANEVGISIIDPFAVTLYTKPAGTGAQNTLLYSDVAQCQPPTCAKPITLGANTITQTTANLTWVQPGAPGTATAWEIVVQPVILGYPSGAGLPAVSPYPATGLSAGLSYEFYVRANCGATDGFSAWAGPFVFNTPVANDDCINAINVPVNDDTSCLLNVNGSVVGATASVPATSPVCAGTANDDVWFKFVALGPKHYISFSNVAGSTTDLNHAIYSGASCAALTQMSCQNGTGVTQGSVLNGLIAGNTYYIRVWTATATANQTTTFTLCIGTLSTCETADAFCSDPLNPFIFPNTVGVPSEGAQSCLGTNPNPTYYFMSVLTSGNMQFQISQNTSFDAAGNPTGTGLDVDFIAWGPFASNTAACGNLIPANQVGCSYSAAPVENFTIPNAIAGQVYVVVITNFNNGAGFIKFHQVNQTVPPTPGVGSTDCSIVCEVDLGPDQNLCGVTSVILDSQLVNAAATYKWYRNGVLIVGATSQTYTATQSGTYKCVGTCGPNDVDDTMVLNLGPNVVIGDQPDYSICDDISNDGIATFDLSTLTANVLLGLDTNFTYTVTFHYTEQNALDNVLPINPAIPYVGGSQTIYIRVVANGSPVCNTVVPQNLVVNAPPVATLVSSDADNTICLGDTATITVTPSNFVATAATYAWTLDGVLLPAETTAQITPLVSGLYEVTIDLGGCINTLSMNFTVNPVPVATIASSDIDNTICSDQTATITVTPVNFLVGNATYSWTLDGVLLPAETSNVITPTVTGTYEVTVTLNGCTTTLSLLFTINPLPIATIDSSDADDTICSNDTATITVTPVNFVATAATYAWTLNGNPIAGTTNTITPTATGTYAVTVSLNGCSIPLSMVFTINALPDFALTGTNLVKCANEISVLTVEPTNFVVTDPNITYSWSLDGTALPDTTSSISVTAYGIYTVVVDNQGCTTSHQIEVSLDTTNIDINSTEGCIGVSYIITTAPVDGSFNPDSVTYEWTNEIGDVVGSNQSTFNVSEYVAANNISAGSFPLTFTVKITTIPDGCVDTKTFDVASSFCTIQRGISPNGDGDNETFDLTGLGVKQLSIFNRYGTKVYSYANYTNQWRGQSDKGNELPDGTYYYVIDQNSGETKSGWIYINK